jgi:hypothetical protein
VPLVVVLLLLLMVPGLALLIFLVIQFLHRGQREIEAATKAAQGSGRRCRNCGHDLGGVAAGTEACPKCGRSLLGPPV